MAVTVEQLAAALNLTDENAALDSATRTLLTGLLAASQARVVVASSSNTPPEIIDEAITRMSGYLFDRPHWSESGNGQASAYHHSGAAALLAPWRRKRALTIGE